MIVPVRFVYPRGSQRYQHVMWTTSERCDGRALHSARRFEDPTDVVRPEPPSIDDGWVPSSCDSCGAAFSDAEASRSSGSSTLWTSPSGQLEPGNMFWADWLPHEPCDDPGPFRCADWKNSDGSYAKRGWHNCVDGRHLNVMLPNGITWDVDSRASNCDMPNDVLHRCWQRRFNPETETPKFTVGKDQPTCGAGAGSIQSGDYHGFLHDGALRPT
jgi:hypothetical protein